VVAAGLRGCSGGGGGGGGGGSHNQRKQHATHREAGILGVQVGGKHGAGAGVPENAASPRQQGRARNMV